MIANELKNMMEKYNGYTYTIVDASGAELEIKEITDGKIVLGKKTEKEKKSSVLDSVVGFVKEAIGPDGDTDKNKKEEVEMLNPKEIIKKKK